MKIAYELPHRLERRLLLHRRVMKSAADRYYKTAADRHEAYC